MYLTSASDSPTGRTRARNETSQRRLFEIGAECAVIVDQASEEGRDAGSEREREAVGIIYSAQTKLEKVTRSGKTARMRVRET